MKKLILFALSIVLFSTTFFWTSCRKTDDEGWTDEEKASYEEVLNLQDEVSNNLDEWFLSMDSLDAIDMAYQYFVDNSSVSEATINNKGIAVQYANGIRGGLFLKGKLFDYKKSTAAESLVEDINAINNLKSIVNGHTMLQMDAAYSEFSYYTDQVHNLNNSNLSRVGISITDYLKDSEVTVDRLTQLDGYGIIDMSGHGIPWPKESYITEIYYLTGESVNETTSKKYWDDIKTGSIPLVKTMNFTHGTKYCVSPDFISSYNDFSNDTIFFYGGFCYSFLGGWPDIINDFGDGAYLGFDWSVQGYHCANWDINSLALMSDTSKTEPINLEEWMNDGSVDKSYNQGGRTISIHYTGDGNLTLWGDVSVNLIAMSNDGTPVSKPGEAGVAYPFKCEVVSNITELEYVWDMGSGSSPVTAGNAVNITWSENGNYNLTVQVKDKSNGNIIGMATANVTIGAINTELIEVVTSCKAMNVMFGPEIALQFSPSVSHGNYMHWWIYGTLVWDGLNFSGSSSKGSESYSISGSLSTNGQYVSLIAIADVENTLLAESYYYKITITDLPLTGYETDYPNANYEVSANFQNYVSNFEGTKTVDGVTGTVTGIDWNKVERLYIYFEKE